MSVVFDRSTGDAVLPELRHRRSDGAEIEKASLDEELWSPNGKILTVLFNPGRVKTGIDLHDRYGRALHAGEAVELIFNGRVINEWQVISPETRRIDPGEWRLASPRSETRAALVVSMGGPIDAMDADDPVVLDASGKPLQGRTGFSEGESVWTFTPDTKWNPGRYVLILPPSLEEIHRETQWRHHLKRLCPTCPARMRRRNCRSPCGEAAASRCAFGRCHPEGRRVGGLCARLHA
jgi:hypothetical protein